LELPEFKGLSLVFYRWFWSFYRRFQAFYRWFGDFYRPIYRWSCPIYRRLYRGLPEVNFQKTGVMVIRWN